MSEKSADQNQVVYDANTLTLAIQDMFDCQEGPLESKYAMQDGKATAHKDGQMQYQYITHSVSMIHEDSCLAQKQIAKNLHDKIKAIPSTVLVWRIKPEYSCVETESKKHHTIRMRVGFPYLTERQVLEAFEADGMNVSANKEGCHVNV